MVLRSTLLISVSCALLWFLKSRQYDASLFSQHKES